MVDIAENYDDKLLAKRDCTMSLQDEIDEVVALGEQLLSSDSSARKQAVTALKGIFETAWAGHKPHTSDPEIMPAFRINSLPQLAQAIRGATETEILFEMVSLAFQIGPGEPSMTEALVHRMRDGFLHEPGQVLGGFIVDTICRMGVPARLYAIKESKGMDSFIRIGIVANLTVGGLRDQEQSHGPVLVLLSESSNPDDWDCLCELSHIFEGKVSRADLRGALVKVWRKADGVLKENIAYTLRRRGFARIGPWWL